MIIIEDLEAAAAEDAMQRIGDILGAFNDAATGLRDRGRPLALVLRDSGGEITGGLTGRDYYGWLFISLLFVPTALRGQKLGERLMAQAEAAAANRGCTGVWLDTFSFQARGFYQRLGYDVFGEIPNYPPGHARYFMKKHLTI
jgi:GNAT superfamily N-acetyltransferase